MVLFFLLRYIIKVFIFRAMISCIITSSLIIAIDFFYYGNIKFTLWNFVKFNVLSGGSAEFGINSWYWYVQIGLPSVITVSYILLVVFTLRVIYYALKYINEEVFLNLI